MLDVFGLGLFAEDDTCVICPLDGSGPTAPSRGSLAIVNSAEIALGQTDPDFAGTADCKLGLAISNPPDMSPWPGSRAVGRGRADRAAPPGG